MLIFLLGYLPSEVHAHITDVSFWKKWVSMSSLWNYVVKGDAHNYPWKTVKIKVVACTHGDIHLNEEWTGKTQLLSGWFSIELTGGTYPAYAGDTIEIVEGTNSWSGFSPVENCTTVGGIVVPVDKLGLLAPYIGLASTIIAATAATAIYVKRVKRRKEKQ